MKEAFVIVGFIVSIFVLYGIVTCGWLAWWMIPTAIACVGCVVTFAIMTIKKVRNGEW